MKVPTEMKSSKYVLLVNKREICLLQWMIEAFSGIASMRTIDPKQGKVEISIPPGCEEETFLLIESLNREGIIHVQNR